MNPIIMLWATPRSTSTAFEWMMRMRGDMTCFHEPFGEAWYQGPEAMAPRIHDDPPAKPDLTFDAVIDSLRTASQVQRVFVKDMAHYVEHLCDVDFLAMFRHSFLIRDPAKVLASMERSYAKQGSTERFTRQELSFDEQRRLFDRLCDQDGSPPPVLDSDDLLSDPHGMVNAYCSAMGIPFLAGALTWEPGDRSEVLWYDRDGTTFHDSLMRSDGLKPQVQPVIRAQDLPNEVRRLHDDFSEHYRHLRRFRLRPPARGGVS